MKHTGSTHEERIEAMKRSMARAGVPEWHIQSAVACAEEQRMLSDTQKRRLRRKGAIPGEIGIRERMRREANESFLRRHPEFADDTPSPGEDHGRG